MLTYSPYILIFRLLQRFRIHVHVLELYAECGFSNRFISTFVLPQFDGPQTIARIETSSISPCLHVSLSVCTLSRFFALIATGARIFSFSTKYWKWYRERAYLYSRVERNRSVIKIFLVVSDDVHSALFNLKRIEIPIENCTAARVWKLHRFVVGQFIRSYTSRFWDTISKMHYNLPSHRTYIDGPAFDKELQRMLAKDLLNHTINTFPFELHIPGYQFCGPGTHLEKRLARNDIKY